MSSHSVVMKSTRPVVRLQSSRQSVTPPSHTFIMDLSTHRTVDDIEAEDRGLSYRVHSWVDIEGLERVNDPSAGSDIAAWGMRIAQP